MTSVDFRSKLLSLGISLTVFADITGMNFVTVSSWGKRRSGREIQTFPGWVPLLLDAWLALGGPPNVEHYRDDK